VTEQPTTRTPLPLGKIVVSEFARRALVEAGLDAVGLLARHQQGDWGELNAQGRRWNDAAAREGGEVSSYYRLPTGVIVQVVTDPDRSLTVVQLPSGN